MGRNIFQAIIRTSQAVTRIRQGFGYGGDIELVERQFGGKLPHGPSRCEPYKLICELNIPRPK